MISTLNAENVQVQALNWSSLDRDTYKLNESHTDLKQRDIIIHRKVLCGRVNKDMKEWSLQPSCFSILISLRATDREHPIHSKSEGYGHEQDE